MSSNHPPVHLSIDWPCETIVQSKRCESRGIQTLPRTGQWGRCRGLSRAKPNEIQAGSYENRMTLYQALSFRRTLLRSFPNGRNARTNLEQWVQVWTNKRLLHSLKRRWKNSFTLAWSINLPKRWSMSSSQCPSCWQKWKPVPEHVGPHQIFYVYNLLYRPMVAQSWIDAQMYYASTSNANHKYIQNG